MKHYLGIAIVGFLMRRSMWSFGNKNEKIWTEYESYINSFHTNSLIGISSNTCFIFSQKDNLHQDSTFIRKYSLEVYKLTVYSQTRL